MAKKNPRRANSTRTCLFCGATGPLTDEHIYGDWLHKLGFTGEGVREITGDGIQPVIQKGSPFSKKLNIACEACNTGWMSVLEESTKPLLIALFNARGTSVELDEDAQLLLSRWAFKTAAVSAQVGGTDPFPDAHRREFYWDDRPPRHARIWIGTAPITPRPLGLELAEYAFRPRQANVHLGNTTFSFPFYRSTFRLLTVVFDIVGYVSEDIEMTIKPSGDLAPGLLPIWPAAHPRIWWPPTVSLDIVGGVTGLAAGELVSIPTFLPRQ